MNKPVVYIPQDGDYRIDSNDIVYSYTINSWYLVRGMTKPKEWLELKGWMKIHEQDGYTYWRKV